MKTSHRGLIAIEGREGVILHAYKDSKGLPTIGVGHLIVPGDGFNMKSRITQEQCDELFAKDIEKYEAAVNRCVKVPLKQNQFDACVSFALNIGTGGFCGSSVVKRLNAKDYDGAAQAFMKWVKPKEITGRRRSEQKQFLTPYPNSAAVSTSGGTSTAEKSANAASSQATDPAEQTAADNPTTIHQEAENIINAGDMGQNQQDINKPAKVEEAKPYNEIGLKQTIINDAKPMLPANGILQFLSDYAEKATGWPPWVIAWVGKAALILLIVTIAWILYRLIAWLVWTWKENERVKLLAQINSDPTRKDLHLTPTPQDQV